MHRRAKSSHDVLNNLMLFRRQIAEWSGLGHGESRGGSRGHGAPVLFGGRTRPPCSWRNSVCGYFATFLVIDCQSEPAWRSCGTVAFLLWAAAIDQHTVVIVELPCSSNLEAVRKGVLSYAHQIKRTQWRMSFETTLASVGH
jgi:hypothetical protein